MARERDAEWLTAARASALLDVKRATLYAYVSRGLVRSRGVAGTRARLYHRDDLTGLKARHDARSGHAPVAASALRWGEPVLDSSITEIRADGPAYRGHAAVSLVRDRVSFEQTAELLWTGALGKAAGFQAPALELPAQELSRLVSRHARPLDAMLLTLSALSSQGLVEPALGVSARLSFARSLILELAASTALPAGLARYRQARSEPRVARRVLVALGGKVSPRAVALVDAALLLCADHELNASAFACRVATSAGADLSRAISAGLCTISGTEHGGTTERIEALVAEVGTPERAARVIAERMRRGEAVVGFGHRLYRAGDARTTPMLEGARALGKGSEPLRTLLAIVDAMELAGAEPPALDVGLVAVACALRLARGAPLALFALGRIAGFVAHADEQRAQGVMLRPRARYVPPL